MPYIARTTLLAAATLLSTAQAQTNSPPPAAVSQISIGGVLDVGAGRWQLAGRPFVNQVIPNTLSTSRLTFSGFEDLGGGWRANFFLSQLMRPDVGAYGRFDGDAFWSSRSTVGLSGPWGQFNLGRMNAPTFFTLARFDAHELGAGAPVFLHTYPGGQPILAPQLFSDSTINNGIQYATPNLNGFTAVLHAGSGEVAGTTRGRLGYSLTYVNQALSLAVAGDVISAQLPPGESHQSSALGAAAYDFGVVKLSTIYQQHKQSALDNKYRVLSLGASMPLGPHKVMVTWARTELDRIANPDPTRDSLAVTYDHFLSKRTDLYVHGLHDRVTALKAGNSLVVGMRHRF
jgi:predicted porin